MAQSPAHTFGQIIGDVLESAFKVRFQQLASQHSLFFDSKGTRPARAGKKVTWTDALGNSHDLDYVLERGGSATRVGQPVAFIELAYRRYTKHSKNKVQEIESAVASIASRYHRDGVFLGAILAGEFTGRAIKQLQTQGFVVLHIAYREIILAFSKVNIDACYTENTPMDEFETKIEKWKNLTSEQKKSVGEYILEYAGNDVKYFLENLEKAIQRRVESIFILPLYGSSVVLDNVEKAMDFIADYTETSANEFSRYEIIIRFTTSSEIRGNFVSKAEALEFLNLYGS